MKGLILSLLLVPALTLMPSAQDLWSSLPEKAPETTRVFLVRHAESVGNTGAGANRSARERDQLTSRGNQQALRIAELLSGMPLDRILSSPTNRTRNTLMPLAEESGRLLSTTSALSKMQVGMSPNGRAYSFSDRVSIWEQGRDPVPEEGESLSDVAQRVFEFFRMPEFAGETVIACTHGDVLAAVTGAARLVVPHMRWTRFTTGLGFITVVDIPESQPARVLRFNYDPEN